MKKVLMVGAAVGAILVGAAAMAQGGGVLSGANVEKARWSQDDDRGWGRRHDERRGGHHRWGHGDEERGMGRHGGRRGERGMRRGARLEAMFDEVDIDKDGVLTTEEIDGFKAIRFAAMDANADGQVAPDELVAYRMMQRAKRQIARMDQNDDGLLSLEEMPDRTPPFARFDLDQNGSVTKAELEIARDSMRGGRRGEMRGGMRGDGPRGDRRNGPRAPMDGGQDQ